MISHQDVVHFDQMDETYSLRKHWSLIKLLVKQRTQLLNQLNNLVYQANPELLIYCRRSWPDWLLELLKLFPTAQDLAEATIAQLDKIPYVESKKVQEILRQARQSVASANDPVSREMIKAIVEEVIHKGNLIESCKKFSLDYTSLPYDDKRLKFNHAGLLAHFQQTVLFFRNMESDLGGFSKNIRLRAQKSQKTALAAIFCPIKRGSQVTRRYKAD